MANVSAIFTELSGLSHSSDTAFSVLVIGKSCLAIVSHRISCHLIVVTIPQAMSHKVWAKIQIWSDMSNQQFSHCLCDCCLTACHKMYTIHSHLIIQSCDSSPILWLVYWNSIVSSFSSAGSWRSPLSTCLSNELLCNLHFIGLISSIMQHENILRFHSAACKLMLHVIIMSFSFTCFD